MPSKPARSSTAIAVLTIPAWPRPRYGCSSSSRSSSSSWSTSPGWMSTGPTRETATEPSCAPGRKSMETLATGALMTSTRPSTRRRPHTHNHPARIRWRRASRAFNAASRSIPIPWITWRSVRTPGMSFHASVSPWGPSQTKSRGDSATSQSSRRGERRGATAARNSMTFEGSTPPPSSVPIRPGTG